MNILLDTNIILSLSRAKKREELLKFLNPNHVILYTSVAVEAEIKSIAVRQRWGNERLTRLDAFLKEIDILDISQYLVHTYVELDTFSQRENPNFNTYHFDTPRNMGKNDLWIASTATLLGLELITTDDDFAHLHNVFLEVRIIKPEEFRPFF